MPMYITDAHMRSKIHQRERRAVQAGRALWLIERPRYCTDVRQPTEAPRRHVRRGFGEGILRSLPTYRSPASLDDMAWWEAENAREQDREVARMEANFIAQERMSMGLHPY